MPRRRPTTSEGEWILPSHLDVVSSQAGYRLSCQVCGWLSTELDPVRDLNGWRASADRHSCILSAWDTPET